ncbi:MAG: zinc-ribbon domain-containing protein [Desulfobacterales bacterium]|nr:zinc-ribbon domain-containing protein [Desulfobacterales bacterium]
MDITCDKCQSKFKIPDEKIPTDKVAILRCPKCKEKITVGGPPASPEETPHQPEMSSSAAASETYDASDKPFDFVEEEGKTALVCESDPGVKKTISNALTALDYHITDAENARDALKKMRYHNYDLILANEEFDTADPDRNGVLIFIERLNMSIRRDMFVVLISNRFRTMDNMMAFNKSVNIIINFSNIKDFDKILRRGLTDNDYFYRIYKEMMRKTGRI